jgi:hypothetical protein
MQRTVAAWPGAPACLLSFFLAFVGVAAAASEPAGQNPVAPEPAPASAAAPGTSVVAGAALSAAVAAQAPDDDLVLDLSQPDFTVINLPTALRLARFKWAFRVTHRFARPLGAGDFGNLVEDLFGLDSGAAIGLEARFGLWDGWQAGVYRRSDRTLQFFTQYNVVRQGDDRPVGLDAYVTTEGTDNFRDVYSSGFGAIVSRRLGERGALYAEPLWLHNTNLLPDDLVEDNSTLVLGLGARVRVRPTVYAVGEVVPRLAGFRPGEALVAFGIEKRAGGHVFQFNVSNGLGTTPAQVARSFATNDDWYIGFNISRKFY